MFLIIINKILILNAFSIPNIIETKAVKKNDKELHTGTAIDISIKIKNKIKILLSPKAFKNVNEPN